MTRLVTLTTDFGTRDSYVAEMKGVLLTQGPADLRLCDASHALAPFRIHDAALFLRAAVPRFPAETIHLVVVDPSVGSSRQAIVARVGGYWLVGPDNGVFGYLFDGTERVHAIDLARLPAGEISRTFHGRDVFAPAAARLARGASLDEIGPPVERYERMRFPMVEFEGDQLHGCVIHVDHFGNLVTNVSADQLRAFLGDAAPGRLRVQIGSRTVEGLCDHYAACESGSLLALVGSSGLLEVAAREAHAARKLGVEVGAGVRLHR